MAVYFYIKRGGQEGPEKPKFYKEENALREYALEHDYEYNLDFIVVETKQESRHWDNEIEINPEWEKQEWRDLELRMRDGDSVVFKDFSCFPFDGEFGYAKYMELYDKGIELVFIDDSSLSTEYIRNIVLEAIDNEIIDGSSVNDAVRLHVYAEFKRIGQARSAKGKRIKDGVAASGKKSGRKEGQFDKLTPELVRDIEYYVDYGGGKKIDIMYKHDISRNTLNTYIRRLDEYREKFDELRKKGSDNQEDRQDSQNT